MEAIEVFSVTENADSTEGKGPTVDTGICFTSETDAVDFASSAHYKKFAVMGFVKIGDRNAGKHNVRRRVFELYDSMEDYEINSPIAENEKKRFAALAKLTDEEKELLGL